MGYLTIGTEGVTKAYGYMPNLPANVVACVLFGVVLLAQLALGTATRDWWMLVTWGITGGLEVAGFAARALAHQYPQSLHLFEMQETCLVFAPAFMAAGIYYQLAKEITVYGTKYSPLRPMTYTAICTTCDVLALLIQGGGGGVTAAGIKSSGTSFGVWIMLAGLVFQLATLVVFMGFFAFVSYQIFSDSPQNWEPRFKTNRQRPMFRFWLPAVAVSILFLLVRSIYRVAELAHGFDGYLFREEQYFLVLDGLMILLSMIPLTVVYPALAYGQVPVEGVHYKRGREPRQLQDEKDEEIDLAVNFGATFDAENTGLGADEASVPPWERRAGLYSDTRAMIGNERTG